MLKGVNFSVSWEKLKSVATQRGDILKIEKLADDMNYRGDGIVKITNVTKRVSTDFRDWEVSRLEERDNAIRRGQIEELERKKVEEDEVDEFVWKKVA